MGEAVVAERMEGMLVLEEVEWCPRASVSPRSKDPLTAAPSACPWVRGEGNPVRWA